MLNTAIDLFSGIGGFSLAARWAGLETIQFCEIDPFCKKVISKNFPGVPIHGDITTFDGKPFRGRVGWLFGGYPCQDLSVAGKGRGFYNEDGSPTRSGLWFECLRVIRECRPARIVIENVPALRTRGIDTVLEGLEEAGYTCWPLVVGADDVGAPHRRKRVWVVGFMDNSGHLQGRRLDGQDERHNSQDGWELHHAAPGDAIEDVEITCCRNSESSERRWSRSCGPDGTGTCYRPEGPSDGMADSAQFDGPRPDGETWERGGASGNLADTDSSGRREQCRSESVREEQPAVECDSEQLADFAVKRCGEERNDRCDESAQRLAGCIARFPPGPTGDWSSIDPEYWPVELAVRKSHDGVSRRLVRRQLGSRAAILRGLGNAVVPATAYAVIRALDKAYFHPPASPVDSS